MRRALRQFVKFMNKKRKVKFMIKFKGHVGEFYDPAKGYDRHENNVRIYNEEILNKEIKKFNQIIADSARIPKWVVEGPVPSGTDVMIGRPWWQL